MTTPAPHAPVQSAAAAASIANAPTLPPKRRPSETEQDKLLAEVAEEKLSVRPAPGAREGVLELDDFNPLSDNVEESSYLAPLDSQGYTEMERRVLAVFKDRIAKAQREIPKGIPLKIFKNGEECGSLASKLMHDSDRRP